MAEAVNIEISNCYHCGDSRKDGPIAFKDKIFCCEGCKLVYEILEENNLCSYYNLDSKPGISLKSKNFDEH